MRVWRIYDRRYAASAFDGEGARLYGGRWNSPGVSMVYTAASPSLAVLEVFVHLDPEEVPDGLLLGALDLPDDLSMQSISPQDLPADWRSFPAPEHLRSLGDQWVQGGASLLLAVPSAVIPEENNYLINPRHPEFQAVRQAAARPFTFDPRLWK